MKPAERARILRKVGDLITERAPEIARIETTDTGLPIAQTGGAQIPRAADNFYFFAEMANHMDGAAYHSADYLNYTVQRPAGCRGADYAVEPALHAHVVEGRALPRQRLHLRRQARLVDAPLE